MSKGIKEQFVDWLRTKPSDEEYDYSNCSGCAFSQFLKECGFAKNPSCSRRGWSEIGVYEKHPMPIDDDLLIEGDWTFGALLSRLTDQVQS